MLAKGNNIPNPTIAAINMDMGHNSPQVSREKVIPLNDLASC